MSQLLDDITEILTFLRSLWGLLGAASLLFPVSNLAFDAILVPRGQEKTFAVLATVTSLFALLLFVSRRHVKEPSKRGNVRNLDALSFFGLGFMGLVLYLGAFDLHHFNASSLSTNISDIFVRSMLLPATYALFFGGTTAAFTILGVNEYRMAKRRKP